MGSPKDSMPNQPPSPNPAFRVLVVVSRPLDLDELPIIADQWALLNGLATVKAPVEIKVLRPPTIETLRAEILSGYDILHFDGHGAFVIACPSCRALNPLGSHKCGSENCGTSLENEKPRGFLAFEQEDGTQDLLPADDLAEMLQAVPGSHTKLVVLSACESAKGGDNSLAASLIRSGLPCALGMKVSVSVSLTIVLSKALYSGLGAGMTISNAFKSGLLALSRLPDIEIPEPASKDVKRIKAKDVPELKGDGSITLTQSKTHGSLILERTNLFGVPDYDFVGEFTRGDPPRGRKGLLFQVIKALNNGEKIVVLTGQGGIGKSVLAAMAARRIAWRYPGGVFWRSAADIENLDLNKLLDAFNNIFGYEFRTLPLDAKQTKVLSYLQDLQTPSLIVVDNAEIIKDPAIWRFLEGLPRPSAALVTTREALKREGTQISVIQMEPNEAARLFIIEARKKSPRWGEHLQKSEADALDEITRILEGHPLGIKLAAALVSSDSLESIRQRLRKAPPKEISDRFDFSYNTLTESQQMLLHRLAAFSGSVADWAIEAISTAQLSKDNKAEQLDQWRNDLSELVRKSFVDFVNLSGLDENENEVIVRRYRLHPLMRQYAAGKAGGTVMKSQRCRAAHIFLGFAEQFVGSYSVLGSEHDNILAGADWSQQAREWDLVKRFAWSMDPYLRIKGYWNDLKILLNLAIKATDETGDRKDKAKFLLNMGILLQETGNIEDANSFYNESLNIFQEFGDKIGIAKVSHQLGMLKDITGNCEKAKKFYELSISIKKEMGDDKGIAKSTHQLGILAFDCGKLEKSKLIFEKNLKMFEDLGDKTGIAKSLGQLGMVAEGTGDFNEAKRLYFISLGLFRELEDKQEIARSLGQIGILLSELEVMRNLVTQVKRA